MAGATQGGATQAGDGLGRTVNRRLFSSAIPGNPPLDIEGVDVGLGLTRFGGKVENYLKALTLFAKDLEARLGQLELGPGDDLQAFRREAHSIKSASANIGADGISKEAAFLEGAANDSDNFTVHARCESFRKSLKNLALNIRVALDQSCIYPAGPGGDRLADGVLNVPTEDLVTLKDSLADRDIGGVDRILDRLQGRSNDPRTTHTLQKIAEHVLLADYEDARRLVMEELSRKEEA
jgi:HPt (histidine-containing phosphotransfer) domain-containing protein